MKSHFIHVTGNKATTYPIFSNNTTFHPEHVVWVWLLAHAAVAYAFTKKFFFLFSLCLINNLGPCGS